MRRIRSSLISLLVTALVGVFLVACGHAHGSGSTLHFSSGGIALKNGMVVIKVKGQDTAQVSGDGALHLGDHGIAVSPAGRALLARYNAAAQTFVDQAMKLGMDSADFALHTIDQVFSGLLHGTVDQAGKEAKPGGQAIGAQGRELCQRLQDLRLAQDAATAAVPEFRTYAVIMAHDTAHCTVEDHAEPAAQISS